MALTNEYLMPGQALVQNNPITASYLGLRVIAILLH